MFRSVSSRIFIAALLFAISRHLIFRLCYSHLSYPSPKFLTFGRPA